MKNLLLCYIIILNRGLKLYVTCIKYLMITFRMLFLIFITKVKVTHPQKTKIKQRLVPREEKCISIPSVQIEFEVLDTNRWYSLKRYIILIT